MEKKDVLVNFKASKAFKERLKIGSQVLDRPISQLLRESYEKEMRRIARHNPELKKALEDCAA
jgi:predicted DNA-binding protein